ncbi:hypothetical protein A2Z67_02090 [Candidatus Woesebacteria bacterium RBG_13_36_22]|uniref:Uncharacterized protein n=1 Tax=Candidatus Woesebacteria bacterium RBG_13_36_22 TaxID=1802478 RepID=A0A1F7X297_9BACT|nr:MAG: hypothetical protein A2Z67_02090 [Candidatus Woesebacteria bacterium RBG_13_36_22]
MTPEFSQKITDKLTQHQMSVDKIKEILKEEGLFFSDDSVKNIAHGLMIHKEMGEQSFKDPFFIYGSTAKGTAGTEPKIQEIQYWKDVQFLGSTFRIYGTSDLDIRCISEKPESLFEGLTRLKGSLFQSNLRPADIRIESYEDVRKNITRQDTSSFYRRVLLLNSPIFLSGGKVLNSFATIGRDFLVQDDLDYEREIGEVKNLVRSRLEGIPSVFLLAHELATRYPNLYSENNLIADNFQRTHSFKISFSLRESSLIPVQVSGEEEIEEYVNLLEQNPSTPFKDLKRKK